MIVCEFALHAADNVHHVAVTFYRTIRFNMNRSGSRNATQIVACQVNEHDVLCRLFWVGQQRRFIGEILCRRHTARQGTGDRSQLSRGPLELHQRLGRAAHDLEVPEVEEIHVWRWVQAAQTSI